MHRGDVYRFKVPKGLGHEQLGERYGVVVQADEFLPRAVVLVEQVAAVDAQRLGRRVGLLTASELWSVDEALSTVLGLA